MLIVIIIVAAALAVAGLPTASVAVLLAEAGALGVACVVRLRGAASGDSAAAGV
ncbi:hypothetical protein [Streptomyces sp. NPDC058305]|uniref:hypothetical protein n=1 Tax=Streptomyces sp. NPDC058305 TaxID=3346438 RepID=UPI0036E91351